MHFASALPARSALLQRAMMQAAQMRAGMRMLQDGCTTAARCACLRPTSC